ncbi:branched-chain amino acid aminotransferase [Methanophagales archaeon]|nr:branched-chain amino acid aminotransferase [Methanophagales archaeon]
MTDLHPSLAQTQRFFFHNSSQDLGENIFAVKNATLYTPEAESSIIPGMTRDSVIALAQDIGYEVVEKLMTKEELLNADEAFVTGTAARIAPILEVDNVVIGKGKRGEVTGVLQGKFFDMVNAKEDRYMGWLEPVYG